MQNFRNLPKVDELLRDDRFAPFQSGLAKIKTPKLVRTELECLRNEMSQGKHTDATRPELHEIVVENVCRKLSELQADRLRKVVNATGIVMHTNLGRSVLCERAAIKLMEVSTDYSNLEYSTITGARRPRLSYVEQLLAEITGAEAALVVNNNAAAVFLTLNTLSNNRSVVVSRGEMVEIGDGFRIGEIIAASGCSVVEVGATNRTTANDYHKAIASETAAILKIHTSNYRIVGYTGEASTIELSAVATQADIPLIEDMGSGILIDLAKLGFPYERTPMDAIAEGADIVTFSGDKCLGGPQAGLIVGKKAYIDRLRRNQLMRCLRIDKLCLAALEATLEAYINSENIPTNAMFSANPDQIREKADILQSMLTRAQIDTFAYSVQPHNAQFGGGAMPTENIPSYAVYANSSSLSASKIELALRSFPIPIIATIQDDNVILDVLTINENDFPLIVKAFLTVNSV